MLKYFDSGTSGKIFVDGKEVNKLKNKELITHNTTIAPIADKVIHFKLNIHNCYGRGNDMLPCITVKQLMEAYIGVK